MNGIFESIFTSAEAGITVFPFLLSIGGGLLSGVILALASSLGKSRSGSFLLTMALLPAVVAVVIMMVNGNIGAGVAVMGAFSLVRFRSAPGSAREITAIFMAMAAGLMCGMGYLGFSILFAVLMGIILAAADKLAGRGKVRRMLRITVPEDLDFEGIFDDIFVEYLSSWDMIQAKTSNMGSLYKLKYDVTIKDPGRIKSMIDELRVRNGNLEISLTKPEVNGNDL